ncbi:MAG TPA: hypothetical protein VJS44_03435, partial [Pyrinomonadaceae bacterium]|nr:hypothetical protein [Pyrinomonadaceae bacterium]
MNAKNETWQVMCADGTFETDLEGLKEWVAEGRILATDKVRKGNLRWIEAGRAPVLRQSFEPAWAASPLSGNVAVSDAPPVEPHWAEPQDAGFPGESFAAEQAEAPAFDSFVEERALQAKDCYFHVGVEPKYICGSCASTFCADCTKFTSKIPICSLCGELCRLYEEVREKSERRLQRSAGFGFTDFSAALSYPFKNLVGLLCGAFFYALLQLGGIKGQLLASAILFGCISIVINKMVMGRTDGNFFPDMSAFSLWDDVLMPIFLGLGVTIITIGPALLLALMLILGVVNSVGPTRTAEAGGAQRSQSLSSDDMDEVMQDPNVRDSEGLSKKIEEVRERKMDEERTSAQVDALRWLFGVPALLIPVLLLALAWAVFYYPMALSIAGYTEDFWSVVNPLVGLDTIRRMGATYFKAFGMYLAIQSVAAVLNIISYWVLAPFDLPFLGNLPAHFVGGAI